LPRPFDRDRAPASRAPRPGEGGPGDPGPDRQRAGAGSGAALLLSASGAAFVLAHRGGWGPVVRAAGAGERAAGKRPGLPAHAAEPGARRAKLQGTLRPAL